MPDAIPPNTVLPFSRPHVGREVGHFAELDSTNEYLLTLARDPANAGLVAVADRQTAGRGQHGRAWFGEPRRSLLLSALVFPSAGWSRPACVTAWAAVAVGRAIGRLTGSMPAMKWPNDLLLGGKKCCGILTEQRGGTVVGVGLNLAQTDDDFAAAGLPLATSLGAFAGRPVHWSAALEAVVTELDGGYGELESGGRERLESDWRAMLGLEGERVAAERADGAVVEGRLTRLTLDGVAVDGVTVAPELVRHIWRV